MEQHELRVDVTEDAGLGEPAAITVTVHLPAPESLGSQPIVCFAKPGGGFSRGYFTTDLPGPASGAEADWHAARGWVFVSVDHLGVGASSTHDMMRLDYRTVAGAADAAERAVLEHLQHGTLSERFPPVPDPVVLGVGQSMGGCLTVVQQARHGRYDGIAVLGYSVVHTHVPTPPNVPPIVPEWRLRDDPAIVLNAVQHAAALNAAGPRDIAAESAWAFFHDDVDLEAVQHGRKDVPWASATYPGVVMTCLTPGVIASEAAGIDVPVLVAMGERDVVADPQGEPRAYLTAPSVDLFVCPRMAHMHNFAGTRQLLWERIQTWGAWVAARSANGRQT